MPEVFWRFPERPAGKERRKIFGLYRFFFKGPEISENLPPRN